MFMKNSKLFVTGLFISLIGLGLFSGCVMTQQDEGSYPVHRVRGKKAMEMCQENLSILDTATQQWALDNGKSANDIVYFNELKPYLRNPEKVRCCPQNGKPYKDGIRVIDSWQCPNWVENPQKYSGHKIQ